MRPGLDGFLAHAQKAAKFFLSLLQPGLLLLARITQSGELGLEFFGRSIGFDRLLQRFGFCIRFPINSSRTSEPPTESARPARPARTTGRSWATRAARATWSTILRRTESSSTTRAARRRETARPADGAPGLHDRGDALGNGFPFGVVLDIKLFAQSFHHALPHLFRIEISWTGPVLGGEVANAGEQRSGQAERANGRDSGDYLHLICSV